MLHIFNIGRVGRSYTIALGSTAAQTPTGVSVGIKNVRIVSSVDAWYVYGPAPQTISVGVGTFIPAGFIEILEVSPGEVFSVIPDTASSGNFNVSEITR